METFKRFKVFIIFLRTAFGGTKLMMERINCYKIMTNRKNLGMSLVYRVTKPFHNRKHGYYNIYILIKNCTFST